MSADSLSIASTSPELAVKALHFLVLHHLQAQRPVDLQSGSSSGQQESRFSTLQSAASSHTIQPADLHP
jgi:hypothetical protein